MDQHRSDQHRSSADWDWVDQTLLADQALAIFFGAGISRQAGLPVVNDLVPAILRLIDAPAEVVRRIAEIPFEAFIEVLGQNSPVTELLAIFAGGRPGTNHRLLAELVRRGAVTDLCTTNFDLLVERAGTEIGIEQGGGFAVLHTADDLESESWTHARPRLVKIHGSACSQGEMAVTISHVAGKIYSAPRAHAIEHFFADGGHGSVLVLGYSGSDAFDLSPQIEALAEHGKPVYVVEHTSGAGDEIRIEPLGVRLAKNPFRNFPRGYRIFADTDRFVRYLWEALVPDRPYPAPEAGETPWRAAVEAWGSQLSSFAPSLIRGSLLQMLGLFEESIAEFETTAALGSEAGLPAVVAVGLSNQVAPLLRRGNPGRAAEVGSEAVAAFRQQGMLSQLGNQLGWLGNTMLDLGCPEEALRHHREARAILEALGDRRGAGNQRGNTGNALQALQRYGEAISEYEAALEIAEEVGNVHGVVNQLIGLSQSLLALGRPGDALPCSRRGESVAAAFGLPQEMALLASLSGAAYHRLGSFREAVRSYENAVALAREERQDARAEMYLKDMAAVLLKLGEWDRASQCVSETDPGERPGEDDAALEREYLIALAESKSGKIDSARARLQALLNKPAGAMAPAQTVQVLTAIANIEVNRGNPEAAIRLLDEALCVWERDDVGVDAAATARSALGLATFETAGPEDAKPLMEEALSFAVAQGNLPNQGHCHEVLARIHGQLGNVAQATIHARAALEIGEATGNREQQIWALGTLGNIHVPQNDLVAALECFTRGLVLSQEIELATGIAIHRRYRANVFSLAGMEENAISELLDARKHYVSALGEQDAGVAEVDAHIERLQHRLGEHWFRMLFQPWHEQPAFVPHPQALLAAPAFHADLLANAADRTGAAFCFGRFLYRSKKVAEAISVLRSCETGSAWDVEVHNYLGNLYYANGQPGDALEALEAVLSAEPDHQNARFLAGLCSNDLGRIEQAAHHYARVGPEHPWYATAVFNLALCEASTQHLEEARRNFEEFIELEGDDAEAWLALAAVCASLGDPDAAQSAVEKAAAAGAGHEQLKPVIAAAAAARDETRLRDERRDRIRADPSDADTCLHLALDPVRTQANLAFFEQIIAASPGAAPPHHALGLMHHQAGEVEKAASCYEGALARAPSLPYLNYHYALLLSDALEDYDRSRLHYEREIGHHPERIQAHHNLGLLLWKRFGDRAGAEQRFLTALDIDPSFELTQRQLAALRADH